MNENGIGKGSTDTSSLVSINEPSLPIFMPVLEVSQLPGNIYRNYHVYRPIMVARTYGPAYSMSYVH